MMRQKQITVTIIRSRPETREERRRRKLLSLVDKLLTGVYVLAGVAILCLVAVAVLNMY